MQIDYLNLENSVKISRENILFNQGEVTVEVFTQLINDLRNRESKRAIRKNLSIYATLIISVINGTVLNQILTSNIDRRIISSQNF